MSLARLAEVLARTTGLDARALGTKALAEALPAGVAADDEGALARLAATLEHDGRARRELRARLLVHETSFFRYPASFACMVEHLARRLAQGRPSVRVLSAACSTGQEPASLAMALLEAGVPPAAVRIDAFDVSESAVARARAGLYAERELVRLAPARRARFTHPVPGGARLDDAVLGLLTFTAADLLDADAPPGSEPYDLVLCRNVLIYLTPEARLKVLDTLGRWLASDGLLFVGHAEVVPLRAGGWAPVEPLEAYALRRVEVVVPTPAPWPAPTPAPPGAKNRAASPHPALPAAALPAAALPAAAPAQAAPVPLLVRARRLAEEGRADEALGLLEGSPSGGSQGVEALHLAAVLARALGRPVEVERALTRALYLDPAHVPALRLAALVAEESGDAAKARRLRERADRAERAAAAAEGA